MSDAIITVENLGKRYHLGASRGNERYTALRDVISEKATGVFGKLTSRKLKAGNGSGSDLSVSAVRSHLAEESQESISNSPNVSVSDSQRVSVSRPSDEFWALKNVSFEVKQGEVLGIIGRNGAGKSTLLKILSRITEPTEGRIKIKGRVASLLEVGTGFHPELTGRENIFLNGAILGMHRHEIKAKFDEIVAFAEVEKFLDTPVKRYSSGMYVRLAFAVAAHLEPEILVVDEVLAVGDAEFQKKCLGKMQDVSRGGRTVLFVSHNMAAVRNLCSTGLLLLSGEAAPKDDIHTTVQRYLSISGQPRGNALKVQGGQMELRELFFHRTGSAEPADRLLFNERYGLTITVHDAFGSEKVSPVIEVFDEKGTLVSSICGPEEGLDFLSVKGSCSFEVALAPISLMPGSYELMVRLFGISPEPVLELKDALHFEVEPAVLPNAFRAYRFDHGLVRLAEGMRVDAK